MMSSLDSINNNAYTQLQPQEVTAEPRIQTVSGNHLPNVVARIAAIPVVSLSLDFLADNAYTCWPYALVKRVSSTVNTLTKPIQIVLSPMIAHVNNIANFAVDALLARCPVLLLPQPGDVTTNVQCEDSMGDVPAEVMAQVPVSLQVPTNSTSSSSSLCMSESALLSSAAVQWMRIEDGPRRVINSIHRQLTAFEGSSREMFRENFVLDATTNSHVPHSYQRLVRSTEDAPHDVFQRGFLPLYTDEDLANDTAFNLEKYLHLASRDEPRIFVSTTRPSRVDGRLHVWKPLTFAETIFEYEVYARGGIDVNRVIPDNQFLAEQEIAFPGGIHRESIRLASERRYGELVAVWWNDGFDLSAVPNLLKPKIRDNVKEYHWAPTA